MARSFLLAEVRYCTVAIAKPSPQTFDFFSVHIANERLFFNKTLTQHPNLHKKQVCLCQSSMQCTREKSKVGTLGRKDRDGTLEVDALEVSFTFRLVQL